MSTTLEIEVSAGTLKKSKALLDNDQIQKIDDETFYVAGSKEGEIYEIGVHKIHGFVCNKTNASEPNEKGSYVWVGRTQDPRKFVSIAMQ